MLNFFCRPGIARYAIALAAALPAAGQQTLTYDDLVARLYDPGHLSVLPQEGEVSGQWSSYNRDSRYDEESGKYVSWDHNRDGEFFIRKEGSSQVIAEMEGPGVVYRIWSALARQGHVKIIIDGHTVVDMPFNNYFEGEHAPFDFPALSYTLPSLDGLFPNTRDDGGGRNLYLPIPYQESCKIVANIGWGRFYLINYLTFPEGTQVPSFTGEWTPEQRDALEKADRWLSRSVGEMPTPPGDMSETIEKSVTVKPGQTVTVADLTGPAQITALRVRGDFDHFERDRQIRALRELTLQMTWDDADAPAVWSPLGDFFGTAPGVNHYQTLLTGMTGEGFYAYWPMPFAERGLIEVSNDGDESYELKFEITYAALEDGLGDRGHFHAKWHRDLEAVSEDRWPDWRVLETQGRGRFCGMALHVWSPMPGSGPQPETSPGHWWWGEGDEKFFVDGEKFPSWFGTGTEDYFGYAWCDPTLFTRPWHAQSYSENNAGHQSVMRLQVADNVPFQKSFDGYLEKYFPNDLPALYAVIAYWYLAPDGEDPLQRVAVDQRLGYFDRPALTAGRIDVVNDPPPPGLVQTQAMNAFGQQWTDMDQLWWSQTRPDDELTLKLPVDKNGRYDTKVVFTRAADYGIVQPMIDGQPVGDPIDLFHPQVGRTEVDLGSHTLTSDSTLTLRITGMNPQARPGYMVGVDQINLTPEDAQ